MSYFSFKTWLEMGVAAGLAPNNNKAMQPLAAQISAALSKQTSGEPSDVVKSVVSKAIQANPDPQFIKDATSMIPQDSKAGMKKKMKKK